MSLVQLSCRWYQPRGVSRPLPWRVAQRRSGSLSVVGVRGRPGVQLMKRRDQKTLPLARARALIPTPSAPPTPSRPSQELHLSFRWERAFIFPIAHMGTLRLHQGLIRSFLGWGTS